MIKTVHPFPARMAPELALQSLGDLKPKQCILDPMSGSGTVLRQALEMGLDALGYDMDPLAVLMAKVWTTPCDVASALDVLPGFLEATRGRDPDRIRLHWIDNDQETKDFIDYWFGSKQIFALRQIAGEIRTHAELEPAWLNLYKLALSRIIVTKEQCASLARDTSHSRPHKVAESSNFDVISAFERSVRSIAGRLSASPLKKSGVVRLGDARLLNEVGDNSIDAVLTSPPYLNAIDYIRGHRLALVWLGYRVGELRTIRSNSIGSERGPDEKRVVVDRVKIKQAMGDLSGLPKRFSGMIDRYADDIRLVMAEVARVLKPHGRATFVVGDNCLRSIFILNSGAVSQAAAIAGLREIKRSCRDLPNASRYLPLSSSSLSKRMRTEIVLTFGHA